MLGGPKILQAGTDYESANGTHRWRVWRTPNADFLYFEIQAAITSNQNSQLVLTAGTGDSVTMDLTGYAISYRRLVVRVPWNANDTGWQTVTMVCTDVGIRSVGAYDWPRTAIEAADHGPLIRDLTYPRISLREGDPIADATDGSVRSVLVGLQQAWDDHRRVAGTWSSITGITFTKTAPDWGNPFGMAQTWQWRHRARAEFREDDSNEYLAWVWASVSGGATYSLRFEADNDEISGDSVDLTGLTGSSITMREIGPVTVDAIGYGGLTITGQITAGSGNITIHGVTIGEE